MDDVFKLSTHPITSLLYHFIHISDPFIFIHDSYSWFLCRDGFLHEKRFLHLFISLLLNSLTTSVFIGMDTRLHGGLEMAGRLSLQVNEPVQMATYVGTVMKLRCLLVIPVGAQTAQIIYPLISSAEHKSKWS